VRNPYLSRVSPALRARSVVQPGTMELGFRLLFLLERESLAEIHNSTVHAFLCAALREHPSGYRLYWAVYVKPASWLTPMYMALIEPFRRFIVYPAMLGRVRRAWIARYPIGNRSGTGATGPGERRDRDRADRQPGSESRPVEPRWLFSRRSGTWASGKNFRTCAAIRSPSARSAVEPDQTVIQEP
jgi:hypothetical protein